MMPLIRLGAPLRPFGGEVLEGRFLAFGKRLSCAGDASLQVRRAHIPGGTQRDRPTFVGEDLPTPDPAALPAVHNDPL